MAPFMCASAFVHEALITQPKVSGGPDGDMAGSHLVFSQDPQPPPPVPRLPHPQTTPCFSAPGSLSLFTIFQLGGLNTLHTESQPAERGDPRAPSPASLFLWVQGLGRQGEKERQSAVSPPAKSDHGRGLFAVSCFCWTTAGTPGVAVGGKQVPVSEGRGGGSEARGTAVMGHVSSD